MAEGLQVEQITVRFGGFTAVDGVSFRALKGEVTGIIGPNGAGKSSLLNAIMGLVPLRSGSIRIGDRDLTGTPSWQRSRLGLGRAFQHVELFENLTVAENVLLGRHHMFSYDILSAGMWFPNVRNAELRHREATEEVLEFFEISRWRDHRVTSLPYGTQKIVGLARAVASEPSVLLLDEVGSGLTRDEKEHLARYVLRLQAKGDCSILWVEHDIGLVRDLSDHIVVLDNGRKLAQGTPKEVFALDEVLRAFVGVSASP